jgi:hypothetical protein
MRWSEVARPIVGMVQIPGLIRENPYPAAGALHEAGGDRGEHPAAALVIGAVAAGGRGALSCHELSALAALRFSRRRSTFCLSRSA